MVLGRAEGICFCLFIQKQALIFCLEILIQEVMYGYFILSFYIVPISWCCFSLLLALFFDLGCFYEAWKNMHHPNDFQSSKHMAKLASFLHHSCLGRELFRLPFCKLTDMLLVCFITTFFFQSCKVLTSPRIALFVTILIDSRV